MRCHGDSLSNDYLSPNPAENTLNAIWGSPFLLLPERLAKGEGPSGGAQRYPLLLRLPRKPPRSKHLVLLKARFGLIHCSDVFPIYYCNCRRIPVATHSTCKSSINALATKNHTEKEESRTSHHHDTRRQAWLAISNFEYAKKKILFAIFESFFAFIMRAHTHARARAHTHTHNDREFYMPMATLPWYKAHSGSIPELNFVMAMSLGILAILGNNGEQRPWLTTLACCLHHSGQNWHLVYRGVKWTNSRLG